MIACNPLNPHFYRARWERTRDSKAAMWHILLSDRDGNRNRNRKTTFPPGYIEEVRASADDLMAAVCCLHMGETQEALRRAALARPHTPWAANLVSATTAVATAATTVDACDATATTEFDQYLEALTYHRLGETDTDTDAALSYASRAISIHQNLVGPMATFYALRAKLYERKQMWRHALQDWELALAEGDDNVVWRQGRSRAWQALRRLSPEDRSDLFLTRLVRARDSIAIHQRLYACVHEREDDMNSALHTALHTTQWDVARWLLDSMVERGVPLSAYEVYSLCLCLTLTHIWYTPTHMVYTHIYGIHSLIYGIHPHIWYTHYKHKGRPQHRAHGGGKCAHVALHSPDVQRCGSKRA